MRVPLRNTLDLCLAAVSMLLGIVLDASLLSVFNTNLKQVITVPLHRQVDSRSIRRGRIRF
jgi:hypothetical protein